MKGHGGERGASAVELAVVVSLLFLILFGIIQFGIAYNRYQGLQAGSREGARLASLPSATLQQIEDRVRQTVSIVDMSAPEALCPLTGSSPDGAYCIREFTRSDPAASPVEVSGPASTMPCAAQAAGATVLIEVQYRMQIDIPLLPMPAKTITTRGEFQCENGPLA